MQKANNPSRCVITPTYSGHFKYIKKYLESFDKYLVNKDFPIYFIITKAESEAFNKIIKKYKNKLNLNVVLLDDVFAKYGIDETPENALKKYGRLSFQTLKKLYSGLYVGADQFLLLDSESEIIRPTNLNELFDKYFEKPSFVASRVENRSEKYFKDFTYNYIKSVAKVLGNKPEYWLVESYNWFYELRILKDLIKDHGEIIDIIKSCQMGKFNDLEGILECLLYYQYIINNNDKYKYHFIVFDESSKTHCPEYISKFNDSFLYMTGMFESFSHFLDKGNIEFFEHFVSDNNLKYVLRFENSFIQDNLATQIKFVNDIKPNIIASSQNHSFGIENKFIKKVKRTIKKLFKRG